MCMLYMHIYKPRFYLHRYGGWIVDSFPMTRESWTAMIEASLLPDFVINLDDEAAPDNYLLDRFTKIHDIPSSSSRESLVIQKEEVCTFSFFFSLKE